MLNNLTNENAQFGAPEYRKLKPYEIPQVTEIDSRNFNDEIQARVNQDANECDFCVFKSDYSTMGTPGKLLSPDLEEKFNTLKYICTYGAIYSWTVSFWTKTDEGFTNSNYLFRLYPAERSTLNAKNREYLQKVGMDFSVHALYGLRYVPGQQSISSHGIQYLFSSVLSSIVNRNCYLYCFNGMIELACLYNSLYVELPDDLYRWCKDLNYFNVADLKPFFVREKQVTQGNHLFRLYAKQVNSNPVQVVTKSYSCQALNENKFGCKLPFRHFTEKEFKLNVNLNDDKIFMPITTIVSTGAIDVFHRKMAMKLLPIANGTSKSFELSACHTFGQMSNDVKGYFNGSEISQLINNLESPRANTTENNLNSIYDTPSQVKGFYVGYLVAALLNEHPKGVFRKELQLLSKNCQIALDLEGQKVFESKYSKYHDKVICKKNFNEVFDRRKDVGVFQFTKQENGESGAENRSFRGRADRGRGGRGLGKMRGRGRGRGVRGRGMGRGSGRGMSRGRAQRRY